MSLPAFLRAYEQLGALINALEEKGRIQKNPPKEMISSDISNTVTSIKSTPLMDLLQKKQ
jgi:hypothetical protein